MSYWTREDFTEIVILFKYQFVMLLSENEYYDKWGPFAHQS